MSRGTAIRLDRVRKSVIRHAHSSNVKKVQEDTGGFYLEGCVPTPLGIVQVYSEAGRSRLGEPFAYSFYKFVVDGYEYNYSEMVSRTQRGLTLMAHRFAQHVMKHEVNREG